MKAHTRTHTLSYKRSCCSLPFLPSRAAVLKKMCKDTALAQMKAVSAARNIEGITMDGTILNVQKVELVQAKSLEHGVPIILVSSQVQYIHCVRNAKVCRKLYNECACVCVLLLTCLRCCLHALLCRVR